MIKPTFYSAIVQKNYTYTYPSRCIKFGENQTKTDNFPHDKAAHFIN